MKTESDSKSYRETDAEGGKRTLRPIRDPGIGRFPERLKEAIGSRGLRAFGKLCGLSEGALHSYLSGDTFPTLDRLDAIASASGKGPLWFLQENPSAAPLSQLGRLEPETIASALKLLTWAFDLQGAVYDPGRDPDLLADTYAFLVEHDGALTPDNLVDFSKHLAAKRGKEAKDAIK